MSTPANSQTTEPPNERYGIRLIAENLVELEDGFLIQGSLDWSESNFDEVNFYGGEFSLTDANGQPVLFEPTDEDLNPITDPKVIRWAIRTNRKDLVGPLNLHLSHLSTWLYSEEGEKPTFTIDFGYHPADGQTWEMDDVLSLRDYVFVIRDASFSYLADGTYGLEMHIDLDRNRVVDLSLRDLDNRSRYESGFGGGPRDNAYFVGIGYDYLPTGVHHISLEGIIYYLEGEWNMQIELPDTHAVATATPQTGPCLTQDTWKSISPSPVATLPNDLSHSLLLIERFDGGLLPNESLTYADGTLLADLGPGSWPDLSPDGAKVAYAYNGLRVFDVVSSQTSLLISEDTSYSMVWSPDGTRLALIRGADGVYLINADGTDLHRIPDSTADMIGIAGWLPDGKNLVVARIALGGTRIQTLNVDTGEIQDDFLIDNLKGGFTHLSPDGKRVMYSAAVFGEMNPGVYVANLNGSDVGLVAEPGSDFMFTSGAWSPDGQWLILNPYQVGAYHPEAQHPVVVNLNSCQVLILDGVLGEVRDWFWGGERSR